MASAPEPIKSASSFVEAPDGIAFSKRPSIASDHSRLSCELAGAAETALLAPEDEFEPSAQYRRMAVLLPCLHFLVGVANNLQGVAWRQFLIHGINLNPSDQAMLSGVVCALPWNLKILVAFFSDVTPICGMRRVPYLLLGLLLQGLGWLILGFVGPAIGFQYLALQQFTCTMGQVVVGVMCDSLVVEMCQARAVHVGSV